MSQRATGSRSRRPEKDTTTPDSKGDPKAQRSDERRSDPRIFRDSLNRRPTSGSGAAERRDRQRSSDNQDRRVKRNEASRKFDLERNSRPFKNENGIQHEALTGEKNAVSSQEFKSTEARKFSDWMKIFSDESRLSKLIRRLLREDDASRRLTAVRHLKEYVQATENARYLGRAAEGVLSVLQDLFTEKSSSELRHEVAICLGYHSKYLVNPQSYLEWLFKKYEVLSDDSCKCHVMQALRKTIQQDEPRKCLRDHMPYVMDMLQPALENADSPSLLESVVNVIRYVADKHPSAFSTHFRDTVDILVGWHIDTCQSASLTEFTSNTLVGFSSFWTNDIQFSVTLLGQFLEDMEAYSEDLVLIMSDSASSEEDLPPPDECVTKIAALIRVFTTVVRCLDSYFTPDPNTCITTEYMVETTQRVIKSVSSALGCVYSEPMLTAANLCVTLLVNQLASSVTSCLDILLPFVTQQVITKETTSNWLEVTFLELFQKVVEHASIRLPVSFITSSLGPESACVKLRFSSCTMVTKSLMSAYHAVMSLKSVPLLEEAYRLVLGDINAAMSSLSPTISLGLVSEEPFSNVRYSPSEAQAVIVFNVCALAEIGNSKSNLIGMYALSPSIFTLFTTHLNITESDLYKRHPLVAFTFLQTIYSHCSRHNHFVSSSDLIGSPVLAGGMMTTPTTSSNFSLILDYMKQLLDCPLPVDCWLLTLHWLREIITSVKSSPRVYSTPQFSSLYPLLIRLGYNSEVEVVLRSCLCLLSIMKSKATLSQDIQAQMYFLCLERLSDSRSEVSGLAIALLKLIPIEVTTRNDSDAFFDKGKDTPSIADSWLARRQHMSRPPTGNFHGQDFKSIMGYLLFNTLPKSVSGDSWLLRLFHGCQRRDVKTPLMPLVDSSDSLLWFWATWECGQYCIQSRLRTPLGKPQDTFTTIENVLKRHASRVRNGGDDDTSNGPSDSQRGSEFGVPLLLQFMEHLEKLLYNAFQGCAVAMPQPQKAVRTFFRTNKGTCQEWLTRIRLCVIHIASHAGRWACVVRQASDLLREMNDCGNTGLPEFEHVILYLAKAYDELRCPESINGLYAWSKEIIGRKVPGLRASVDKASARYEDAVTDLRQAFHRYVSGEASGGNEGNYVSPSSSPRSSSVDKVLTRNKASDPDPVVANQLSQMVSECYQSLGCWEELVKWQEKLQEYKQECSGKLAQTAFSSNVDVNYIKALSSFEACDFQSVRDHLDLVPWASLSQNSPPHLTGLMWDRIKVVDHCEKQLLRIATLCSIPQDSEKLDFHSGDVLKLAEQLVRVDAFAWPPKLDPESLLQMYRLNGLDQFCDTDHGLRIPVNGELILDPNYHSSSVVHKMSSLLELRQRLDPSRENITSLLSLLLSAAKHSRKQGNLCLAEQYMLKYIQGLLAKPSLQLPESVLSVMDDFPMSSETIGHLERLKIEREMSKWLHATGESQIAMERLCRSLTHFVVERASVRVVSVDSVAQCNHLSAKSVVTMVTWLTNEQKMLTSVAEQLKESGQGDEGMLAGMTGDLSTLLDIESRSDQQIFATSMADSDALVGRLYHLATRMSPDLAKAWFVYAGWCYKWGRKTVDSACQGSVDLTTDERSSIMECLPKGINMEETDTVMNIMCKVHTNVNSEEDISDQMFYDNSVEITRRQLLASSMALQVANDVCVDRLLDVWKRIVNRVHHYYNVSAKSYFRYLDLNAQLTTKAHEDGNITATLRLLRLLVKHAAELRDVLEDGLAHTPTTPWRGIIPQLFSRLNHPESYVRQSVSELLCRVAQDVPHLIVYPAIVGCSFGKNQDKEAAKQEKLLNEYLTENDKDDDDDDGGNDDETGDDEETEEDLVLKDHFQAIVNTLSQSNPRMIEEIQLLVQELRRITLLWDELWLGTLGQHHGEVNKRLQQLENEVKKVMSNTSLGKDEKRAIIAEKHRTLLKPTVYVIERMHTITSQPPQTPHEQWFQSTYGRAIEEALNRLKNPTNPSSPQSSWQMFKQLQHSLQQRAQKRSSLVLKMNEISSKLASLKSTVIAMPGVQSSGQVITIESIHSAVQILPTKTKPKKLVFMGSDGQRYSYLFKGLEDLHLDERIMQFLSIVNNMFNSSRRENGLHRARHYSVTPLGSRSGLIQWVDGATPLFGLYKRWQQREAINQSLKAQASGQASANPPTIPRPSEMFYSKLNPLIKEKASQENRKDWPLSVLKLVLQQLVDETPRDLLAKELWCCSTSPAEWFHVIQTYSRSTAVMSMIGYIIGLGDRHLDNVLVDLTSGEVIHIDYNVCFEKGKGLRVPEKVPFRMTQNLECALGVTGVEGIFRTSCEHVLRVMRKGRETLLTLLEAFVYDPLVDWTTGNETGYTGAFYGGEQTGMSVGQMSKKEIEREISWSLFSIRITEMKSAWVKNKEELLEALPKILVRLHGYNKCQEEVTKSKEELSNWQVLQTSLKEALTDKGHDLYSLNQRFEEYALVQRTNSEVTSAVQHKLEEGEQSQRLHEFALTTVRSPKLQQMAAQLTKPLAIQQHGFSDVMEFLQGAGQGQLVDQCEQIETEMTSLLHNRRAVLGNCRDVLLTYATIVGQLPPTYVQSNRNFHFQQWCQQFITNFTTQKVCDILEQHHKLFGGYLADVSAISDTELKLESAVVEASSKLVKLSERRSQEGADTTILSQRVVETHLAIQQFIKDNPRVGSLSVIAVTLTALCALNKRYLVMEGAASAAGDRLMDLTSREGDWFLDELYSMSGNISQLLSLMLDPLVVESSQQGSCSETMHVMKACHNIYKSLQELHVNFRDIILPESLKSLQSRDTSLLVLLEELTTILSGSSRPMSDILNQLEIQLRNAIMGIQPSDVEVRTLVMKIRKQFDNLLPNNHNCFNTPVSPEMTPGQMLLMGFNGLFSKVDSDLQELLSAMDGFNVPDNWRKVDVVREAKGLQMSAFTDSTLGILNDIFFIKRLVVMQKFFSLCQEVSLTIQGCHAVYEDDHLCRPVKHFIAEFVRKQVVGLPSQSLGYVLCVYVEGLGINVSAEIELKDIGADSRVALDDLCKKALDVCVKSGTFQHHHLATASSLTSGHDAAWRKQDLARRLDHSISYQKCVLQRSQLQLSRFQWLHEDALVQAGYSTTQMTVPNRTSVMSELRKNTQALASQETSMVASQEKRCALEASIIQRLKWAAGANPNLHQVLTDFEEAREERKVMLEVENKLSGEVVKVCNAILHFEAMRTRTQDALASDAKFVDLFTRCKASAGLLERCSSTVTEVEEMLITAHPVDTGKTIDEAWITSALNLVAGKIESTKAGLDPLMLALQKSKGDVDSQVLVVKSLLDAHHRLMSDVRHILKTLSKDDNSDTNYPTAPSVIHRYMMFYKEFSECITSVLRRVMSDDLTPSQVSEMELSINTILEMIPGIYDELITFAPALVIQKDTSSGSPQLSFATAVKKSNQPELSAPKKSSTVMKSDPQIPSPSVVVGPSSRREQRVARDPRTGKAVQERNSYAVGVWRRVRLKLDGRDPDQSKRLSVPEQVDYVISEATSCENLSVLYEGWTAWV